jgi:hypothetical protein
MLLLALLTAAALAGWLSAVGPAAALDLQPQLLGCDQAGDRVKIKTSSSILLDPSCTWTEGVDITASNVTLDCQGAHIVTTDRRYGIHIVAPADEALSDVTVRGCHVEGFLNNVHVEREGFRDLAEGSEYEHAFSNIVIEDGTSLDSRGVGIFVDGYVTGVTLRNLRVEGAGSTGIYLEAGSKDNVVENNRIVNNGFTENGPVWRPFAFGGLDLWFWGIGREGLAIDGSRFNRVSGNSAGGIFLYKNCGEFVTQRPQRWFHRRYGADGNTIEDNRFTGGDTGVWIGSRMGENTLPMECSDPAYSTGVLRRIVRDYALDNVVRDNVFAGVTYGVRVEDDGAVVAGNEFTGDDPAQQAVIVGTRWRTSALGEPVAGTTITGNRATIAGNRSPYRWIHGHADTTFDDNRSAGRIASFCEGVPPHTNQFIFVIAFTPADPANPSVPPTDPPAPLPPPEPMPACPAACTSGPAIERPRIAVQRLGSPAGDEAFSFTGDVGLAYPFAPALDPSVWGLQVALVDAAGGRPLDVYVPGGAYDPKTRIGWRKAASGLQWRYVHRGASPPGGITGVVVRDRSSQQPGLVRFRVRGTRAALAIPPAKLPLGAMLVLDAPTAETGQCGVASFAAPASGCRSNGHSLVCR